MGTWTQIKQEQHLKLAFVASLSAQLDDTQILFPSCCNIHLTVTIIMHYLPEALN